MEEELTKLQDLLDMGFLQPEEYEERRSEILSKYQSSAQTPPATAPRAPSTATTRPTNSTVTGRPVQNPVGKEEEMWASSEETKVYHFERGTFFSSEPELVWDRQNGSRSKGLHIVDNGKTVINASSQAGCLNICRGTTAFSAGKHSWKIHLRNIPHDGVVVVGVCYFDVYLETYVGGANNGWGYLSSTGQKLYSNSFLNYSTEKFGNDDIIGVEIDMDEKTLRFNKNGKDLGLALYAFPNSCSLTFVVKSRAEFSRQCRSRAEVKRRTNQIFPQPLL